MESRMLTGIAWYARRKGVGCKCQLGCPALATQWGFDRLMNRVPVAAGHGRRANGS